MDSKQIEIEGMKELLKENELEIGRLRKEIKNLKEEREIRALNDRDNLIQIEKLKEENKKLNNEIAWLKGHTKYNGITEEYYIDGTMTATEAKLRLQQAEANQNYVSNIEQANKKLKEELERYKKQYEHTMGEN